MTSEEIGNLVGDFTWDFGQEFFVQTSAGNFVFSDPEYNGDRTLRPYKGTLRQWLKGGYGRDKGKHLVREFCGDFILPER